MWFLVRTGFWLSLALLALPLNGAQKNAGLADAILFARAAAVDASGICTRSPGTCETGRKLAGELTERAAEAAQIASLYFSAAPRAETDKTATGSVQ